MDIPLISSISSIMSRLSYFDNTQFLNKYLQIFNINELHNQILKFKDLDITNIFDLKIKNLTSINKIINKINYNNSSTDLSSKDVQYISISTSNFSSVYVVANKAMNTIFVCFRGTYSVKSGLSYLKLSSITPKNICDDSDDGYLLGVFKIIAEIFYTIEESIIYLSTHFLNINNINNIKIISTGHSLGGGAASIFSYLWVKHLKNSKIVCITFGSPRVMNGPLIENFNEFIRSDTIMFKRYVNNGDPFAKLPFTSKKFKNSYYFPDDYDKSLNFVAIICSNIKKTRKFYCNLKSKTRKHKINIKYHGMYLGISYKAAANNLSNLNKEIKRDSNGDTICRIIIGGNNETFKVVFFNLNEAKIKKPNFITSKLQKIKKTFFQIDYKHQDIYINTKMFEQLIKNSTNLNDDNLNPLLSHKLVKILHKNPKQELKCI